MREKSLSREKNKALSFINNPELPPPMEHAIWTEKYRPSRFSEMVGQTEIVRRVKALVEQKNLPHLLFSGPAGIGKTTLALIVAHELFGEHWRQNFLELNASDERGIDVVRSKVKDFARTKAIGNVPHKILYLDECDALTREAQQALRRTMETFTHATRFILSCNHSSKIIDPIQSRCAVFRFKPLAEKDIDAIIERISKEEGLHIDKDAKEALFIASEGDVRRLENILQSCAALHKKITKETILEHASFADPKSVREILEAALKGRFEDARKQLLDVMLNYGLSGIDMIKQMQKEVLGLPVDNRGKMEIMKMCGEVEFRLSEGSDDYLQLEAFLAQVALVGSK